MKMKFAAVLGSLCLLASTGIAAAQSGLVGKVTDIATLKLASGEPLSDKPIELEAGKYYRIKIQSDGSAEKAISGSAFFRNCWVNEIVINDIEVRPLGVDSIEFDDEGEAAISFVCMKPGKYELAATGTPAVEVNIK